MTRILDKLNRFSPRLGPEWGSGGIFGLKFHRNTLYFTLAFEAEAHFIKEDKEKIYEFDLLGKGPRSGGDTYNAVTAVDDKIYFGGWVHAPAVYKMKKLLFTQKYSHIHEYDISEDEVSLLWKDGPGEEDAWAGEVSEIIYDEYNNRLFFARGDGHFNLGLYEYDLDKKKAGIISEEPTLRGTLFLDKVVFNMGATMFWGLQYVDLDTNKYDSMELERTKEMSKDGGMIEEPTLIERVGSLGTAANKLFVFIRGGFFVGNPFEESEKPEMSFVRLFDFPETAIVPSRVNCLPIRGGLLTAYNTISDMFMFKKMTLTMPSVLVFITPPAVKIIGVFGTRITSIEKMGSKILVAGNTMPNTINPIPMDSGSKEISVLSDDILDRRPPALHISLSGNAIKTDVWGGIPLTGYYNKNMTIYSSRSNELSIFEYDIDMPQVGTQLKTQFKITEGRNLIDLSGFHGIVSFKFVNCDDQASIFIELS